MLPDIPLDLSLLPERTGVYLVGGTTRDLLLGLLPVDYDIAVSQNPEIFAEKTATRSNGRLVRIGHPPRVSYRVIIGKTMMDITGLQGTDIQHDLENRDVTINAMAIDLASGNFVDPMGGQKDLAEKRIRMVSEKAFQKDPVRLLRVFRIAAALNFIIDVKTISAVERNTSLIHDSAGERIRSELYKLFSSRTTYPLILQMAETGLLAAVFPELAPLKNQSSAVYPESDLLEHTLSAYKHLENLMVDPPPDRPFEKIGGKSLFHPDHGAWLKCAILLHHIGTPVSAASSSTRHMNPEIPPENGPATAAAACRRLRLSVKEQKLVTSIVQYHSEPFRLYRYATEKKIDSIVATRFFMKCDAHTPLILTHALADAASEKPDLARNTSAFSDFIRHLLHTYHETYLARKASAPLVNGTDLVRFFHLRPSPLFKKVLSGLEEERLAGRLSDRKTALIRAEALIQAFSS